MVQKIGKVILSDFRLCSLLVILLSISSWRAQAQLIQHDSTFSTVNGPVNTIIPDGDTALVFGKFSKVLHTVRYAGVFDKVTGKPARNFPAVNGWVSASIPDGNGGWYLGGEFTIQGTVVHKNLVHILPNQSLDSSWIINTDAAVTSLVLNGTVLHVGGSFRSIGGLARSSYAQIDLLSRAVNAVSLNMISAPINIIDLDTALLFNVREPLFSPLPKADLIFFNKSTGLIRGVNLEVKRDSSTDPFHFIYVNDGKLFVGGLFDSLLGQRRRNLAVVDLSTLQLLPWIPNCENYVYKMFAYQGKLYTSGLFGYPIPPTARYNRAFDLVSGNESPLQFSTFSELDLHPDSNQIWGSLSNRAQNLSDTASIRAYDLNAGQFFGPSLSIEGWLYAVVPNQNHILLLFDSQGSLQSDSVSSFTALNTVTGLPVTNYRHQTVFSGVEYPVNDANRVYFFKKNTGTPSSYQLMKLDLGSGVSTVFPLVLRSSPHMLKIFRNTLYFVDSGLVAYDLDRMVVKWKATNVTHISDFLAIKARVFLTGRFDIAVVGSDPNFAILDALTGQVIRNSVNFPNQVTHLQLAGSDLILGSSRVGGYSGVPYLYLADTSSLSIDFFNTQGLYPDFTRINDLRFMRRVADTVLLGFTGGLANNGRNWIRIDAKTGALLPPKSYDMILNYTTDLVVSQIRDKLLVAVSNLYDFTYSRGLSFKLQAFGVNCHQPSVTSVPRVTLDASSLTLYPNPASSTIWLKLNGERATSITITDRLGRVIHSDMLASQAEELPVDVSSLASGLYYCKVTTGSGVVSKSFVVR